MIKYVCTDEIISPAVSVVNMGRVKFHDKVHLYGLTVTRPKPLILNQRCSTIVMNDAPEWSERGRSVLPGPLGG